MSREKSPTSYHAPQQRTEATAARHLLCCLRHRLTEVIIINRLRYHGNNIVERYRYPWRAPRIGGSKSGYARNYLIPAMAPVANATNRAKLENYARTKPPEAERIADLDPRR
jgi:hypothetical protein